MKNQTGNIIVLVSVSIFAIFSFASLAISTGMWLVACAESQRCADAAALGATCQIYSNVPLPITANIDLETVINNLVSANDCDLIIWRYGHWDGETFTLGGDIEVPEDWTSNDFINAIEVTAEHGYMAIAPLSNGSIRRSAIAAVRLCNDCNGIKIAAGSALVQ